MTAPRPAGAGVFLDRDGVVNEDVHRLTRPEQLKLIPGSAEAVRRLNEAGVSVALITNQSVVARGMCSESDIEAIHARLAALLAGHDARLDSIYFCPHHVDGSVPEYARACRCRKPGTEMLERAAREHSLRLDECFVIGDSTSDIQAAANAGCRSVLVATGYGGSDRLFDARPTWRAVDLLEAVGIVLREMGRD